MSSDVVITAESVGKRYVLGERESYRALRDVIAGAVTAPVRRVRQRRSPRPEIWALEDVSFTLGRGEVLGLIGANGAGKSTLLKILSRITDPTKGRVVLRGRVGSLLEVGTGFHPELTGRENIMLNGTILGMRRAEIVRRFDEIVEFSGAAKFLDTPVKRYSSGMQVRLAFAVAAHLEPEILLVDEVLAVGDAEFQQKCLGKMRDVTREGRTVIFVSHNLAAVRSLCPRALVLEKGRLVFDGPTEDGVHRYLGHAEGERNAAVVEEKDLQLRISKERLYSDQPFFECTRIAVLDEEGLPCSAFGSDEEIAIEVDYTVFRPIPALRVLVSLADENQVPVLRTETIDDPSADGPMRLEPGAYRSVVRLPRGLFGETELDLNVSLIAEVNQIVDYSAVATIEIRFAGHGGNMRGNALLRPQLEWRTESADERASTSA
ncbi:MAG TPA: polysaccharide ABC transporter ATP-binding protein [Gaiellaceae bacterium]